MFHPNFFVQVKNYQNIFVLSIKRTAKKERKTLKVILMRLRDCKGNRLNRLAIKDC